MIRWNATSKDPDRKPSYVVLHDAIADHQRPEHGDNILERPHAC